MLSVGPSGSFGFDRIAMRIEKFPQVTNVAVITGRADLTIQVEDDDLEKISKFVTDILAPMEVPPGTKAIVLNFPGNPMWNTFDKSEL